ncbi:MmcQ/YjbR family DNA-binding protein [Hasllibacter sp. MH4015]|uniref:MmcQ/YjbR family DNA-binding protein n=1 Tax=Hasllibacter sp. MH4015 TaxID=2854029 RepID=UPI001CD610D0|nr:MmcQ/YjbR family DNA-binding protein [Hasllibacter sp. MH4015]
MVNESGGDPIVTWPELRAFALSLDLPKVEDAVSWGNPNLKAHGKLWCWWSPYVDAAIFKGSIEEREMLMQTDPETFLLHDHYAKHGLILVAAGRIDRDWAEARLRRTWAAMAPRKWLAAYEAGQA